MSFRTIFAMFPALVLGVLVLQSVGALDDSKASLRRFLEASGLSQIVVSEQAMAQEGESADQERVVVNLADQIILIAEEVEEKLTVGRVGPIGVLVMIWTALTLATTAERSLNRIFGAHRSRSTGSRLVLYWSALTLGPLALIAAAVLGKKGAEFVSTAPIVSWLIPAISWVGPIIVGILVVAAMYKLLPNTHVQYRAAVGGAVISVPLWLLAKWGFAQYVSEFVSTGNLYGAIGVVPLFLLWLNVSWMVLLFGAEVAHTAANLDKFTLQEQTQGRELGPDDMLAGAILLGRRFVSGEGAMPVHEVGQALHLPVDLTNSLLARLEAAGIACLIAGEDEAERFILARPPDRIHVLDVVGLGHVENHYAPEIRRAVKQADDVARRKLDDVTLAQLI